MIRLVAIKEISQRTASTTTNPATRRDLWWGDGLRVVVDNVPSVLRWRGTLTLRSHLRPSAPA